MRQRALSQGLLNAEQAARLTEAETLELILQPGFSTAEEITELSGRGVGLDVVQSVLTRLKGTVQIETAPGRGTTFRLRLPLTLAIIRALMFRVEQRLYALPLNAVAEIARTVEGDIHQVEHYDVLQLRNDVLPLLRLGSQPPSGPETARRKVFVLVINSGDRKFGVIVDGLEGEDELVIKALDDQSITTDLVSGASILGDGRVVLILNMIALMDRFTRGRADATGPRMAGLLSSVVPPDASRAVAESRLVRCRRARAARGPGMKKPVRVLVVDDSALMRKLIPKILERDDSIEVVGTAMDGHFALKKIEDLSPDVITLDLEMPGLNGIDTLKEIMRRWRLPVIVVSSHSTAGAAITLKALALGAFDFVAKPTGCFRAHARNCRRVDQEDPGGGAERGSASAVSAGRNARRAA